MNPKRHSAEEHRWFAAVASLESCVLCGKYGVQVAHRNQGRGLAQKSQPWETAALCPECHYALDNGPTLTQVERRERMDTAILRTHSRLAERGTMGIVQ